MILELLAFILAVICYTVSQAILHGKFNLYGGEFWSMGGWYRKYKYEHNKNGFGVIPAPKNWYYRLIDVVYKERWPTSTWLTVAFTDGYHLFQALFKIFLCLSFAPQIGLIWAGVLWVVWGIVFTIVYRYVQR